MAENNEPNAWAENMTYFDNFLSKNTSVKYLRVEWLDFNAICRTRILHMATAQEIFTQRRLIAVSPVVVHLLSNDHGSGGGGVTGSYKLYPDFKSLHVAARKGYATVNCEFQELDGAELSLCSRTLLRRIESNAKRQGIDVLIGFEIEVIFMDCILTGDHMHYSNPLNDTQGHVYGSTRALHSERILSTVESIVSALASSGIPLQQWHPESAPGQWEFVLAPFPPLQAVDALLSARDTIATIAAQNSLRATLHPKPYPDVFVGTGAHVHISLNTPPSSSSSSPPPNHPSFYASILNHLPAITAFTLPSPASHDRASAPHSYSGGTHVAWGTQNRETPLRKIAGSHYEIKCVDGLANMYLALSAIIGAGLRGISDDAEPLELKDCLRDPASMSAEEREALGIVRKLPGGVEEALRELDSDAVLKEVMGEELVDAYIAVKRGENKLLEGMDEEDGGGVRGGGRARGRARDYLVERY